MQDEHMRLDEEDADRPPVLRALPSARFVQDLELEIRRAARQKMEQAGIRPGRPFEEMVIELRKLVRLLRKTLVPIGPRAEYALALGQEIQARAGIVVTVQQQRRWLMVGGVVGSLLSLLGLLAALLLRRRNGHGHSRVQAKKSVGAA